MVSDRIYDLCHPILSDTGLDEEEKTDRLEELLRAAPTSLTGKALEDAVLGALWRWKGAHDTNKKKSSPPPARGARVIRPRSPAPWMQRAGTPTGSPHPATATPPGLPPAFARTKSSAAASPFSSPRPSPRLPVATPAIPHSPRLSAYQFSDASPSTENYGDYGSDTVDWLVNDDASSSTSYGDVGFSSTAAAAAAAGADFLSPYTAEMSPYDMLRSILQDHQRSDEELEQMLEANAYDLSQTIHALMMDASKPPSSQHSLPQAPSRTYLVGKSLSPSSRPVTPATQPQKSPIVCRYWLASGTCARADCRFAHEVQNHVCKFWLQGTCFAGTSCLFSHDPVALVQQLNIQSGASTPQTQAPAPNFQLQDYDSFPALQPTTSNPYEDGDPVDPNILNAMLAQQQQQQYIALHSPPGLSPFIPTGPRQQQSSRPDSRPTSCHASRAPTPNNPHHQPNFQDDEAFPTLGSAAAKPSKRHHGKRGGHGHHPAAAVAAAAVTVAPTNLADVVRMSPTPPSNITTSSSTSSKDAMRRGLKNNRSFTTSTATTAAAVLAIPAPTDIPWLDTGRGVNAAYMKARAEAFKHGGLRNKFLQSAAQAWNRHDARGAKALSLRGQNENNLMREKHREAARVLYEERNAHLKNGGAGRREVYVDLHGLHPEEAVEYLSGCIREQRQRADGGGVLYAICGTGHHSKNGKDKVGKAVRGFLQEGRWAFREFGVPGERGNVGGVLGIDVGSGGKKAGSGGVGDGDSGVDVGGRNTKVVIVKEDPRKDTMPAAKGGDDDDDDDDDEEEDG